ncbi:hypothetical protein CAEBREN_02565 [Caenorhabditis brenneri]|uniref:Homeobox domain-containing protein n=1 Tax=Caenorhabditis brenneri TaxID=135651 RepID=G0PKZ0_CAEBE|nr:hypothetical protein CAEBREN_02565 [Caenorhabditis brenneri]
MLNPSSPYWLASALGLNAAGNTGSNRTSLPHLVIHSMDYFTDPDYLKPKKDEKDNENANSPLKMQPPTTEVKEASLQPVTEKMVDIHGTDQHTVLQSPQSQDVHNRSINHHHDHAVDLISIDPSQAKDQNQSKNLQLPTPSANAVFSPQVHYPSLSPQLDAQHSYQPKAPKATLKPGKKGQRFEKWQCDVLKAHYTLSEHLHPSNLERLEEQLQLSGHQIRTWFQNRRFKDRQAEKHSLLGEVSWNTTSNNQYSSSAPSSSSTPSHHSSLSPESNNPLETLKERDENYPR